jgi:hypothetical protein
MARTCLNHKDRPAATMCHQCHKPVCKACLLLTPEGSFCSSACGVLYGQFKERMRQGRPAGSSQLAMPIALALLLVVLLVGGVHFAARKGFRPAQSIDLLGRLFRGVESIRR